MRAILNSVPTVWLMVISVSVVLALVLVAVLLIRRFVPATREGFHSEVSAPMLGVVSGLFGLFLAFVIIIAYQNYLAAGTNVSREGEALSSIVRDSAAFQRPGRENVDSAVGAYALAVVEDSWPLMRSGRTSPLAVAGLNGIYAALRTVHPSSAGQKAFYDDAVSQLNTALAARQDRLDSVAGGIPGVIVILLVVSTLVIVGYAVLVGSPNFWFHVLGPAAIAAVVVLSLVALADLSYPFSGNVAISPDSFKTGVLAQFFRTPTRPPALVGLIPRSGAGSTSP